MKYLVLGQVFFEGVVGKLPNILVVFFTGIYLGYSDLVTKYPALVSFSDHYTPIRVSNGICNSFM